MNAKVIISLEGNIGAGKSTLTKILLNELSEINIDFIDEPVSDWLNIMDKNDKNLLEYFYQDKKRWAYTFQSVAYITRLKNILNSTSSTIISDRSLECDYKTFAKMLRDDGYIDDIEWEAYNHWKSLYSDFLGKNIKRYYIYLKCRPDVAISRISKRNREEEKIISIDYINKLHDYHESWLNSKENVFIFDVNEDFVNDNNRITSLKDWIKSIME
jgi:deoxyadenosine/deoxycytidine kinase